MNLLLLGKHGQVGRALCRSLTPLGKCLAVGRDLADFTQPQQLRQLIRQAHPTIIVNAVAYTGVDQAETDADSAYQVNTKAVELLAREAKALDAWLVHYSTDYVFDGEKSTAYDENDLPNPLNVYGDSKWQGEQAIRSSGCQYLIIRTSWVYGLLGNNFAKKILQLAQQRDRLAVIVDQMGTPTCAELIADVTALMLYRMHHDAELSRQACDTYHLTTAGQSSWYHYAEFVLQQAIGYGQHLKVTPERLQAILTADYPLPARRPVNSCLETSKLKQRFDLQLPHWQQPLQRFLQRLLY